MYRAILAANLPPTLRTYVKGGPAENCKAICLGVSPFKNDKPMAPVIDKTRAGLLDRPLTLIKQGRVADVPVMHGTVDNEGSMFAMRAPLVVPGVTMPLNATSLVLVLDAILGKPAAKIVSPMYAQPQFGSPDDQLSAVIADYMFNCPCRRTARALAAHGSKPNYRYYFTYPEHWIDNESLGNYHTSEIALVFQNEWPPVIHKFNYADKITANVMSTYWTNMGKLGSPNDGVLPTWPQWVNGDDGESLLVLAGPESLPTSGLKDTVCDMWDEIDPIVKNPQD